MTPPKTEFDRYAPTYAELLSDPLRERFTADPAFFHERKCQLLRDFLRKHQLESRRLSWLDAGCGQGELLRLAGPDFERAAGCDPSVEMLAGCASADIREQPSPVALPFPDESFDLVTAVCVYHHVDGVSNRTLLTQSIHRVLKPGGVFCIIEHNPWNPVARTVVKRCPVDADAVLLASPEARRLLRSAGFQILETQYFLYLPAPIFRYAGGLERLLQRIPLGGQFAVFGRKQA